MFIYNNRHIINLNLISYFFNHMSDDNKISLEVSTFSVNFSFFYSSVYDASSPPPPLPTLIPPPNGIVEFTTLPKEPPREKAAIPTNMNANKNNKTSAVYVNAPTTWSMLKPAPFKVIYIFLDSKYSSAF